MLTVARGDPAAVTTAAERSPPARARLAVRRARARGRLGLCLRPPADGGLRASSSSTRSSTRSTSASSTGGSSGRRRVRPPARRTTTTLYHDAIFWRALQEHDRVHDRGRASRDGARALVALVINARIRGRAFFRSALYFPSLVSSAAITDDRDLHPQRGRSAQPRSIGGTPFVVRRSEPPHSGRSLA